MTKEVTQEVTKAVTEQTTETTREVTQGGTSTHEVKMLLQDPQVLVMSVSKDVEALTASVKDSIALFRENQTLLNHLLADMQEHTALDRHIHAEFAALQGDINGTQDRPGVKTRLHDVEGKMANIWKVLWSVIATAITSAAAYMIANFK